MASNVKLCRTQGIIKSRKYQFYYWAHPHENRSGYSYSIQMSERPSDVIHLDTAPGTVFTEQDLADLFHYWRIVRAHGPSND